MKIVTKYDATVKRDTVLAKIEDKRIADIARVEATASRKVSNAEDIYVADLAKIEARAIAKAKAKAKARARAKATHISPLVRCQRRVWYAKSRRMDKLISHGKDGHRRPITMRQKRIEPAVGYKGPMNNIPARFD